MPNLTVHESAEDYLETILVLQSRNGLVRSIDIVNEMNFSKPSISIAMKHLRENGYIVMDEDNYISLTQKGAEIATRIYNRHRTLVMYAAAILLIILVQIFQSVGNAVAKRSDRRLRS